MKAIRKQQEPHSLVQHRANTHADYLNYQHTSDLRQSLAAEQFGLCCYCLRRIHPTNEGMKIEHWHCQSTYPDEQLDYGNLLGACWGGEGSPPHLQHCDTKKGDQDLARNPATPEHQIETLIAFLPDGTVESSDPALNAQLVQVLNLNLFLLVRNRKAVLDEFKQSLAGRGTLSKAEWEKERHACLTPKDGQLKEYCQVVVYYIDKKIKKTTS